MKILIILFVFGCGQCLAAPPESCLFKKCECTHEMVEDENLLSNDGPSYFYDIICRYDSAGNEENFPERDQSIETRNTKVYLFDLQSNNINFIPKNAFSGLNIEYLDLNLNKIIFISPYAFAGLLGYVALDLSSNMIEEIDDNAFQHSTFSLRSLKIENNKLGNMDPARLNAILAKLDSLTALLMGQNGLSQMPQLSHMHLLKQLSLSKNQIEHLTTIPSGVSDLNLDSNRIKSIEADTFSNLNHLKYLSLDSNQINYIDPQAFSNLVELVSINLARNYIKHLPNKLIFNLINLDRLDLSSQNQMLNNISAFAFDRQSNHRFIKSIDLSGNGLAEFSHRAFCSHNQSNHYVNLIELSLPNKMQTEVNACWFVHLSRGFHSQIVGLDGRIPRVVFKKSTLFDNAEVHTKCSCEFEKTRLFVNLDGHCLMDDGQLVPLSSYSCQGNFKKELVEAECDSMPQFQCGEIIEPVKTTEAVADFWTTKMDSDIELIKGQEVTTSTQYEKTDPVEKPRPDPVVEDQIKDKNKNNDKSNTLPTKQSILNSSNRPIGNVVLLLAPALIVKLIF